MLTLIVNPFQVLKGTMLLRIKFLNMYASRLTILLPDATGNALSLSLLF